MRTAQRTVAAQRWRVLHQLQKTQSAKRVPAFKLAQTSFHTPFVTVDSQRADKVLLADGTLVVCVSWLMYGSAALTHKALSTAVAMRCPRWS